MQSSPGNITKLKLPRLSHQDLEQLEVISCIESGLEVSPYYDSLIMQVIAKGANRFDSTMLMQRFLSELEIEGVYTNQRLLSGILNDSVFQSGEYDTHFIEGFAERIEDLELADPEQVTPQSANSVTVENSTELKVLSPSSGVFYTASAPGEAPFVELGQHIHTQQTFGLLESMKMFQSLSLDQLNGQNETLYAEEQQYQIKSLFAEDGQQVSTGDLLFVIEPVPAVQQTH